MELTMHLLSNGKTIRNITVRDLKYFTSQSLATQVKKEEQMVSMLPAVEKLSI